MTTLSAACIIPQAMLGPQRAPSGRTRGNSFMTSSSIRSYPPSMTHMLITRADECRLLFITQCEGYSRIPVCPWKKPFGSTAVADVEPKHMRHQGHCHCLKYASWRWDLDRGMGVDDHRLFQTPPRKKTSTSRKKDRVLHQHVTPYPSVRGYETSSFSSSSSSSEVVTQSIFSLLRGSRYSKSEEHIYTHP
jgi:hypothetical protein